MNRKILCTCLLLFIFFSTSCQQQKVGKAPIGPMGPIYQPPKKLIDTNIDLSKVPELKIDFTKYPTLDFDKLPRKPYKVVAETDQKVGTYTNRDDSLFHGKYLLIDLHLTSIEIDCIDSETMKIVWKKEGANISGISNDLVYFYEPNPANQRILNAIDIPSGQIKWKQILENTTETVFRIFDLSTTESFLIFRDIQKEITFALDSNTGKVLWQIPEVLKNHEFVENKQIILYENQQNNLAAVDCKTGKRIWVNETIDLKPINDAYLNVKILPDNKVFIYLEDWNKIINFYLIDVTTGKILKQDFTYLSSDNDIEIFSEELNFLGNESIGFQAIFSIKKGNKRYLSKFDLIKMEELWRKPVLDWDVSNISYHIWMKETKPTRVYLNILKISQKVESSQTSNELNDGFYEIDFETGEILWQIKTQPPEMQCKIIDRSLFLFSPYYINTNKDYILSINLDDHSIKWAFNTINYKFQRMLQDKPLIFSLEKYLEDGKVDYGPYVEFSSIDGKVLAYKDRYDFANGEYRYGYDYENKKLYKMEVQK